ncbi:MAG: hypothetical protein MUQ10_11215 [Anaerolineae bacterium]|nr:hypothetical protein [Anaerolineae bacterium]
MMAKQDPQLDRFAGCMAAAFAKAVATEPVQTHKLSVAGHTVLLRFAGPALVAAILPALAHLEIDARSGPAPEITFHLWDSTSTGIYPPTLPFHADDYWRYGHRAIADDGQIALMHALGTRILFLYHRKQRAGFFRTQDAHRISIYERTAPLQTLFQWALSEHGWCFVHTAAVGTERGGVLLVGNFGAGKSTTALACLQEGRLGFLCDDTCLLSLDPAPQAFGIFSSAFLNEDALGMLPGFDALVVARDGQHRLGRSLIHLHPAYMERLRRQLAIRALLILQIAEATEPRIAQTAPNQALRILGPSSILRLPGGENAMLRFLSDLVSQVPCYRLALARDSVTNARYIARFVEQGLCHPPAP